MNNHRNFTSITNNNGNFIILQTLVYVNYNTEDDCTTIKTLTIIADISTWKLLFCVSLLLIANLYANYMISFTKDHSVII